MPRNLVDTCALIALVDRNEAWHAAVKEALRQIAFPMIATQAVLTETFYFAQKIRGDRGHLVDGAGQDDCYGPDPKNSELPSLHTLMTRYADRPMDFADATLVHVAQREQISTILTIDHADFETYRIGRNKKFRILPAR